MIWGEVDQRNLKNIYILCKKYEKKTAKSSKTEYLLK